MPWQTVWEDAKMLLKVALIAFFATVLTLMLTDAHSQAPRPQCCAGKGSPTTCNPC